MENINIREWQKKYLLKEEVDAPLDEFAVHFSNSELDFEIVAESDIDKTIYEITQLFTSTLHLLKTKQFTVPDAVDNFERKVQKEVVDLVIKAALSAQKEIKRLANEK